MKAAQTAFAVLTGLLIVTGAVLTALDQPVFGYAAGALGAIGWASILLMLVSDMRVRLRQAREASE